MKRLTKVLLSFLVIFSVLFGNHIQVKAGHNAGYAFIDADGNVGFVTYDHHSNTYTYKTIGITVGRCTLGTKKRSLGQEFITFAFNESVVEISTTPDSNGMFSTTFLMPESALLQRIAQFYGEDWLAELQGIYEQPAYVVIDSIMCCSYYDKVTDTKTQYGYFVNDGSREGKFFGNTYWNIPNTMRCADCGGTLPCFKDGWADFSNGISSLPICALKHPNALDGASASFID